MQVYPFSVSMMAAMTLLLQFDFASHCAVSNISSDRLITKVIQEFETYDVSTCCALITYTGVLVVKWLRHRRNDLVVDGE